MYGQLTRIRVHWHVHKSSLPEEENRGDTSETCTREHKVKSRARYHCAAPAAKLCDTHRKPLFFLSVWLCTDLGEEDKKSEILARFTQFGRHVYRTDADGEDVPNRHGHRYVSYLMRGRGTYEQQNCSISM